VVSRSTQDVFQSHLRLRSAHAVEEDLSENYADDVVLLCEFGVLHGRDAIRRSADRLAWQVKNAKFEYVTQFVSGEYAFLRWRATSPDMRIEEGADSFVIRNGRIVMQSVYYSDPKNRI
jgi:hypothetical protein